MNRTGTVRLLWWGIELLLLLMVCYSRGIGIRGGRIDWKIGSVNINVLKRSGGKSSVVSTSKCAQSLLRRSIIRYRGYKFIYQQLF